MLICVYCSWDDTVLRISLRCLYTNIWKHYHEIILMALDDLTTKKMNVLLRGGCMYHLYIVHQRVSCLDVQLGLIGYCHSIIINHRSIGCCMWCDPHSCSRSYVHFCVPWILDEFSNDPCTGTTNDFNCCLHWLSIHVGKCSIARPWFSQGLVGGKTLSLHL